MCFFLRVSSVVLLTTLPRHLRLYWVHGRGAFTQRVLLFSMREIIFYGGDTAADFSVISATFKQFNRLVELYFITHPEEVFQRLDSVEPLPSIIFLGMEPDPASTIELLEHLKAHPNYRWIPVVLISSATDSWSRDEALSAGAAALLPAPLEPAALRQLFSASGDFLVGTEFELFRCPGAQP